MLIRVCTLWLGVVSTIGYGQIPDSLVRPAKGADSLYVIRSAFRHDVRFFYGAQGNSIIFGTKDKHTTLWQGDLYKNTNDYVGMGISYKFLDVDFSVALKGTSYLKESRSNLKQFRLGASYTRRKFALRGMISDSKGFVVEDGDSVSQSKPEIREFRLSIQATFILNHRHYSYAAALYQNEIQIRSAGSLLFRIEPFYRKLGSTGAILPGTTKANGSEDGLEYIYAPGLLLMPGYGQAWTWKNGRYFVSPMLCAGGGVAFNTYKGKSLEKSYMSWEYGASLMVSAGINSNRWYGRVQVNALGGYLPLKQSYFTNTQLMVTFWVGYRFRDLEKFLPG